MIMRLQKYISDCGLMSRRAAESEIRRGSFTVNGATAQIGDSVDSERDDVRYLGRQVKSASERRVYIMLNKPCGYVTTMSDEQGRKCVAELTKDVGTRVYPIGRLDLNSDGLLLLTNDGDLAYKLTHPSHEIPKIYHVKIPRQVTKEEFKALSKSMDIDGYRIRPVKVEVVAMRENESVLKLTLYEGRNRQIRKMCALVGLPIAKLCRVAIGEIRLGDLRPGKWRALTASQVEYLKKIK